MDKKLKNMHRPNHAVLLPTLNPERELFQSCHLPSRIHENALSLLLITLEILRTLCAECRQDISLFARSIVVSVDYAMTALSHDLEVVARSASVVRGDIDASEIPQT